MSAPFSESVSPPKPHGSSPVKLCAITVVLHSGQFCVLRISGNVWKHVWMSHWETGYHIWQVEVRDATKHVSIPRTALSNKKDLAPNFNAMKLKSPIVPYEHIMWSPE